MHPSSLLPLLGMRYKLMWAQVRLRNGKIVLFLVGCLPAALLIPRLLAGGGIGAAVAAIQSGRAEFVARLLLGIFFAEALLISLLLGFGMNKIYSDEALRRFPLTAVERLAGRQFIGVLEPLWLLALAFYIGVAL